MLNVSVKPRSWPPESLRLSRRLAKRDWILTCLIINWILPRAGILTILTINSVYWIHAELTANSLLWILPQSGNLARVPYGCYLISSSLLRLADTSSSHVSGINALLNILDIIDIID